MLQIYSVNLRDLDDWVGPDDSVSFPTKRQDNLVRAVPLPLPISAS
jgi:hypothetical protein